jgi:hypothetical protein
VNRVAAALVLGAAVACSEPDAPAQGRSYRMGFSSAPPRLTIESVIETVEMWMPRADGALLSLGVPWKSLLADTSARVLVRRDQLDLVQAYRNRGLDVVAMVDATDGLAREREAPELVELGRSIREPEVQQVYREYVMAVDSILRPSDLALAMETNLVRLAAPRETYDALRDMVNATAQALGGSAARARLSVTVQVDVAWGRLQGTNHFVGIAVDLADFPFVRGLGLSSYPFLAGFAEPEEVPLNYYARLGEDHELPMMVMEGGWTSGSLATITSSPDEQARWIARQWQLADEAHLAGVYQITFTDLDLTSYPVPPGSILPLFAYVGLVNTQLSPKPALAVWDRAFQRSLLR